MSPSPEQLMSPTQREEKSLKMLKTRARGLRGAKALVGGPSAERLRQALDEAAAILEDAVEFVKTGVEPPLR